MVRFAQLLLADGDWPGSLVAWETLAAHPKAFALFDDRMALQMARGLADWGSVDLYGVTVLGPGWRAGQVQDGTIATLARAPDRWMRRLALVATVPLNLRSRGGTGDTRRTLRVCRQLLDDRDPMVVKAMSWALRALTVQDPDAVRKFQRDYDARVAALVRREVRNKLQTGRKAGSAQASRR